MPDISKHSEMISIFLKKQPVPSSELREGLKEENWHKLSLKLNITE